MAYTFNALDISYNGHAIENTFFKQSQVTDHLSIVFPGRGYTAMAPMLYYTSNMLTELGSDVLTVEYKGFLDAVKLKDRLAQFETLDGLSSGVLKTALEMRRYKRLTLIGKSLGSIALATLSRSKSSWIYRPEKIESIWLTPLLTEPQLVEELGKLGSRQLLAIGTEDKNFYLPKILNDLPASVEQHIFEGADHGLDIEGDVLQSTRLQTALIEKILSFISAGDREST